MIITGAMGSTTGIQIWMSAQRRHATGNHLTNAADKRRCVLTRHSYGTFWVAAHLCNLDAALT